MNVAVFVRNREAIPVRALPFVTGWTLSPDVVAKELAESQDSALPPRLPKLRAYQENEKGELIELLPKEWDRVVGDVRALSERLKTTGKPREERRPEWEEQSIILLPAGVFVWRDELEEAFSKGYSRYRWQIQDEREGDRGWTMFPLIPGSLQGAVMEGFGPLAVAIESYVTVGRDPTPQDWQLRRMGPQAGDLLTEEQGPVLPENRAISWAKCRDKLKGRLSTDTEEISFWVGYNRIHAYSLRLRHGFHIAATVPYLDEPNTPACDLLQRFKYDQSEIEAFSPVVDTDAGPVEKFSAMEGKPGIWLPFYNPSGRYLSFEQVVEFLCSLPGLSAEKPEEIEQAIAREMDAERIMPLRPFGRGISDKELITSAWYSEGSILMLAMEDWDAEFAGWDAITASSRSLDSADPVARRHETLTTVQSRNPRELEIVVEIRRKRLIVQGQQGEEEYSRSEITGKGTTTWELLVLFAKYYGDFQGKNVPDAKKLNSAANRRHLGKKLVKSLSLTETPFPKGNANIMLFKSICASGEGIDAMERNPARWDGTRETRGCEDDEDRESPNLVDPATDYLARHGVDEPLIE